MTTIKIPFPLSQYDGKILSQADGEVWVRNKDYPTSIARRITEAIQDHQQAQVAVIGPDAVNQAVKGIAIARQMWRDMTEGEDLYMTVYFSTIIDTNSQQRTRMIFRVWVMKDINVTASLHQ